MAGWATIVRTDPRRWIGGQRKALRGDNHKGGLWRSPAVGASGEVNVRVLVRVAGFKEEEERRKSQVWPVADARDGSRGLWSWYKVGRR